MEPVPKAFSIKIKEYLKEKGRISGTLPGRYTSIHCYFLQRITLTDFSWNQNTSSVKSKNMSRNNNNYNWTKNRDNNTANTGLKILGKLTF